MAGLCQAHASPPCVRPAPISGPCFAARCHGRLHSLPSRPVQPADHRPEHHSLSALAGIPGQLRVFKSMPRVPAWLDFAGKLLHIPPPPRACLPRYSPTCILAHKHSRTFTYPTTAHRTPRTLAPSPAQPRATMCHCSRAMLFVQMTTYYWATSQARATAVGSAAVAAAARVERAAMAATEATEATEAMARRDGDVGATRRPQRWRRRWR